MIISRDRNMCRHKPLSFFDRYKGAMLLFLWLTYLLFMIFNDWLLQVSFARKLLLVSAYLLATALFSYEFVGFRLKNIRNIFTACSVVVGLCFAATGFYFGVLGYIAYAVLFALLLPVVWVVTADFKALLRSFSKAVVWSNSLVILLCFIFSPAVSGQYYGIFHNPNLLGVYMLAFLPALAYCWQTASFGYRRWALLLIFLDVSFIVLCESRTAFLGLVILIFFYFFQGILNKRLSYKSLLLFLLACLLSLVFAILILEYLSPVLLDWAGKLIAILKRDRHGNFNQEFNASKLFQRLLKGISTDEELTSGRKDIWLSFIQHFRLIGHQHEYIVYHDVKRDAHNSFIQIFHNIGLVGGFAYLSFALLIAARLFRDIKKLTRLSAENMVIVSYATSYFIVSLLANHYQPGSAVLSFVYWAIVVRYYIQVPTAFDRISL